MIDPTELYDAVYEARLLVFLEKGDSFVQVALNPVQFKKVSDAIVRKIVKKVGEDETVEISEVMSAKIPSKVFENLISIHADDK